jgi:hypothetical protein
MTVRLRDLYARVTEWSPRRALRSRAARFAGCPWCEWLDVHPNWPACTCREDCGKGQCSRRFSVLVIDLKPGMRVIRDDTAEPVTVFSVTDPASDGMVIVTPEIGQPWRVASDWSLRYADGAS